MFLVEERRSGAVVRAYATAEEASQFALGRNLGLYVFWKGECPYYFTPGVEWDVVEAVLLRQFPRRGVHILPGVCVVGGQDPRTMPAPDWLWTT